MATASEQIASAYPIPTYRYRVTVGNEEMAFSAVSGMEISHETITYKDGVGGKYYMPGQLAPVNISLKRGVVKSKSQLYEWIKSISLNQVEKKDISISLTNESGSELLITWNVANAFPTKLTAPSLDATSNEVAIEEMSLMADSVTIQFH
ncbi:phage tail protein [Chromobacterium haemolyticum]|uniref:phage tail protein n=1 Tax=Chromobacterium haemolyticum TaxID=394935 RepID=UPI0009D9F488|nr:phage tail protein [Chromobacterium haemolyticum]OQS37532.1 phage tail protein [Chromobacterium haemolyticum]